MMATTLHRLSEEEVEALRLRYERDDPSLTDEDVRNLRTNMSSGPWFDLLNARAERLNKVTAITSGRSEAQIATLYKERAALILNQLTLLINEARGEHGMIISFQFSLPDAFNRQSLTMLEINKKIC